MILNSTTPNKKIPSYIETYLRTVCSLKGIPQATSRILYSLLVYISKLDHDNKEKILRIDSVLKTKIADDCGVKIYSVNKALTELVKKGVIKRISLGTYKLGNKSLDICDENEDIVVTINFRTGEIFI